MTLAGFKSKNHPQQVGIRGAIDDVDDRGTLPSFIEQLERRFGESFTLDVAAAAHNAKASRYFTREDDGLAQSWGDGENVWCNPPYSNIYDWVQKAWDEWDRRAFSEWAPHPIGPQRIVMLLPANRVEQKWWQELVEPHRDRQGSPLKVEFLPGRMRFIRPNAVISPKGDRPPFGCCLLIWEEKP